VSAQTDAIERTLRAWLAHPGSARTLKIRIGGGRWRVSLHGRAVDVAVSGATLADALAQAAQVVAS